MIPCRSQLLYSLMQDGPQTFSVAAMPSFEQTGPNIPHEKYLLCLKLGNILQTGVNNNSSSGHQTIVGLRSYYESHRATESESLVGLRSLEFLIYLLNDLDTSNLLVRPLVNLCSQRWLLHGKFMEETINLNVLSP